jgi:hypothetical protein
MTYIAAFHCSSGIVMCADTQETLHDYKTYVEKISVVEDQSCPLAVGGAGDGQLIEAFTQELIDRTKETPPVTKQGLKALVKSALLEVFNNDVPTLVLDKQYRSTQFLVAAKPRDEDCSIWVTRGRRVLGEFPHPIIGYPTPYNNELLKRPRRTGQNRQLVDTAKPTFHRRPRLVRFYFGLSSVRKSVWTLVRQLRGPHLSTCA